MTTIYTIDELLKEAQNNIGYARLTNTMDQAERAICASIAQAAATTAQAMMMAEMTTTGMDFGKPTRWLRVDTSG